MKKVTIMKEVTVYEAFNGRKFDTEQSCKEYELQIKCFNVFDKVFFWGEYKESLQFIDNLKTLERNLEMFERAYYEAEYLCFKNEEAITAVREYFEYFTDYGFPFYNDKVIAGDIYKYHRNGDGWKNFSEKVREDSASLDKMKLDMVRS